MSNKQETKNVDPREKNITETKQEYLVVAGSYTGFDENGERRKFREGEVVKLTPSKAKKLVNIVRPLDYQPRPVEPAATVKMPNETLRPMNEIGAGLPQDADAPAVVEEKEETKEEQERSEDAAKENPAEAGKDVKAEGNKNADAKTTTPAAPAKGK